MARSPVAVAVARILTATEAAIPRSRSGSAHSPLGPRTSKALPAWKPTVVRRPKNLAGGGAHSLVIEPWILLKGDPTIKDVVKDLRSREPPVYLPDSQVRQDTCMAFYDGCWRKFLVLEGHVHMRYMSSPIGHPPPGEGHMACDACRYWVASGELHPVLVGVSSGTTQEFHICTRCVSEGAVRATRAAGHSARMNAPE